MSISNQSAVWHTLAVITTKTTAVFSAETQQAL